MPNLESISFLKIIIIIYAVLYIINTIQMIHGLTQVESERVFKLNVFSLASAFLKVFKLE